MSKRRRTRTKRSIFETNPKLNLMVTILGGCSLLLSLILFLVLPITKLSLAGINEIGTFNGLDVAFGKDNILQMNFFSIMILIILFLAIFISLIKVKDKRFSLLGGFAGMIASLMIPFAGRMISIVEEYNLVGVEYVIVYGPYIVLTFSLIGSLCLLAVSINADFDKYM